MRYRIKIVEQNDGEMIYFPQYNERIVRDLFQGMIIDLITNWAFRWCYFEAKRSYLAYHWDYKNFKTIEEAEDFLKKEVQKLHDEKMKKKAKEVKKTTYKYF